MYLNDIINNLALEDCPHEIGTISWDNYKSNLPSNIDGLKCYVKNPNFIIKEGTKNFDIPGYADILTGISIEFPEHNNVPIKLVLYKRPYNIEEIAKEIELCDFHENKIQLYEPIVRSAFPIDASPGLFHVSYNWSICVEFDAPLLNDCKINITTYWIDLKNIHPLRIQLANREFISYYLEYTKNEIKKIFDTEINH